MNGLLNIIKPAGMTSHDVIYFLKRHCGVIKAGHTGTLDPDAAGVLPICIGKATRLFDILVEHEKTYRVVMQLGLTTDTYDAAGSLTGTPAPLPCRHQVFDILNQFEGKQQQVPPVYSALKVQGKKAYDYARSEQALTLTPRPIEIYNIQVCHADEEKGEYLLEVACSKGTYIRSLISDIGQALHCGAYVSFLLRTRTGSFELSSGYTLEEVLEKSVAACLLPIDMPLLHLPAIELNDSFLKNLQNGNPIPMHNLSKEQKAYFHDGQWVRLYCGHIFFGIVKQKNDEVIFHCFLWDRGETI